MATLSTPFDLPCGLTLRNRLVKTALAEVLASISHPNPNGKHKSLYGEWAHGGWGAVITGNMMIDPTQCGEPGDIAVPYAKDKDVDQETLTRWKSWAEASQQGDTPVFVQLNHPGRQAPRFSRKGASLAPSAVPLSFGDGFIARAGRAVAFGTPVAMTQEDIDRVVDQFAYSAKVASLAGFKGVQIHGAHGYLLAQFLSPHSNVRTDGYGGSAAGRARIVREVVDAIRAAVPASFCVGIKLNSADHQYDRGLDECIEQIKVILGDGGVDFLEISGGTYEKPRMFESGWKEANEGNQGAEAHEVEPEPRAGELKPTERTAKREAFFLESAKEIRQAYPKLALMVTGGFRSRPGMQAALDDGACDFVGLGRISCVKPKLPNELILNKEVSDDKAVVQLDVINVPWAVKALGMKPLGAGLVSRHFQKHLARIAKANA